LKPIEQIAAAHRCTPAQVALAWILAQGQDIIPIPGTKRRNYLEENATAVGLRLSPDEINRLSQAFPLGAAAGTRYPRTAAENGWNLIVALRRQGKLRNKNFIMRIYLVSIR